jgi:hypothetical protein
MNQKGYTRGFTRLLDRVVGCQVPQNLDLAPKIMAQIHKKKGFHMLRK